jgi:hypothetical protein
MYKKHEKKRKGVIFLTLALGWHKFEWSSRRFELKLTSSWTLSYGDPSTSEASPNFNIDPSYTRLAPKRREFYWIFRHVNTIHNGFRFSRYNSITDHRSKWNYVEFPYIPNSNFSFPLIPLKFYLLTALSHCISKQQVHEWAPKSRI